MFPRACIHAIDDRQLTASREQLQSIPEKLEARISEKQFLSAVRILKDALRMIQRSELEDIGALSDLRLYLSNQETVSFKKSRVV